MKREDLDKFAVESHVRAARAQKEGRFQNEIIPVKTIQKNEKGEAKQVVVDKDDGIRDGTTLEGLSKLKPAFNKTGMTTAGNSSQTTDGAAAVIMARRSTAEKLKLPIIGRFIGHTVVGVPPEIMGVGPGYAVPKILEKVGLTKDDIDVYELNEAFASQALWSCRHIGLDMAKVNPNGGAIALGHPLGCTGARQVSTILNELKRQNKTYGVISMCIGTGMGAAAVLARE
jgi:acetyl-CoA acyltransferase 1